MSDEGDKQDQNQKLSKRQEALKKVKNPGANGKEKGQVRRERGTGLLWLNGNGDWIGAVFHNDIRGPLLRQASENGRHAYDHPRQQGVEEYDRTAFLESQRHWDGDRQQWSQIKDNILNRLEKTDHEDPDYEVPHMYYEGRIVLDLDNHPVRAFTDIPLVLSSQIEGWLMEAIQRIDSRIERGDFRARMPATYKTRGGKEVVLSGLSALGNRQSRFRARYGLTTWKERDGSKVINKYIKSKLTAENLANNTTKDLQELSKAEQEEARSANKGKFLNRAGTRLLTDEERKRREEKRKQSQENKLKRTRDRSALESNAEDFNDQEQPPAKRPKQTADQGESSEEASQSHHGSVVPAGGTNEPLDPTNDPTHPYAEGTHQGSGISGLQSDPRQENPNHEPTTSLSEDFPLDPALSENPSPTEPTKSRKRSRSNDNDSDETPESKRQKGEDKARTPTPQSPTRTPRALSPLKDPPATEQSDQKQERNEGEVDYRFEQPSNKTERDHIFAALEATREYFIQSLEPLYPDATGYLPNLLRAQPYARQYAIIMRRFTDLSQSPAEIHLQHLDVWTGGWENWREVALSEDAFMQDAWEQDPAIRAASEGVDEWTQPVDSDEDAHTSGLYTVDE